jgi:hypothetical protein
LNQTLIISGNTLADTPRNNISPAILAFLSPVKLAHEINHHTNKTSSRDQGMSSQRMVRLYFESLGVKRSEGAHKSAEELGKMFSVHSSLRTSPNGITKRLHSNPSKAMEKRKLKVTLSHFHR